MKWTVVIPTWQRAETLRRLLCELEQQTVKSLETVVVCDGDDAPTRALAESLGIAIPIRWIFHRENLGLAAARNTGGRAARGELLLFLDDDVIPSPELIARHEAAHSHSTWSSVVCGRIMEEREAPYRSRTDELMQHSWEGSLQAALPHDSTPDLLSVGDQAERSAWFGLNCSISKQLFDSTGGFDPVLRSDEEMEYGLRLYRQGVLTRYAPAAIVRHRGSKDMSTYYPRCWRLSGELDVHRALQKQQRSAQTSQLDALRTNILARIAYRSPDLVLSLARAMEHLTDTYGSRLAFAAWARLRHLGEYWSGVRATGTSEEELIALHAARRPILMFHSLSVPRSPAETTYYTSPRRFRTFLSWLKLMDYVHVDPAAWLEGGVPRRSLLLTFDDAYDDLYTELLPAVAEFQLKPVVFVVANRIGQTNDWDVRQGLRPRSLLTLEQLLALQKRGVTIGSHSCTHPLLTSLSDNDLRHEVRDSKAKLEDALGVSVNWFAYPFGDVDRRVRAAVAEAGYKAAMTTNEGLNAWQDPLSLNRIEVDDRDWLLDFALKITTSRNFRRSLWLRLGRKA